MSSQVPFSEFSADGRDALRPLDELETRIQGAVTRLGEAEEKLAVAEGEAQRLQALFAEKEDRIEQLSNEIQELRAERNEVRDRIEALVERIDSLNT